MYGQALDDAKRALVDAVQCRTIWLLRLSAGDDSGHRSSGAPLVITGKFIGYANQLFTLVG